MTLKPLLTRPRSPLELRRLNAYRGRRYELLFWGKTSYIPSHGLFVMLFPYSCLTACAITWRLPKYCVFFSTNRWNKPQVLCALGYNPSFIGQLLHALKSVLYTFSLSNQVIYASSRCLLVHGKVFPQALDIASLLHAQIMEYSAGAAAVCMYIVV